MRQFFHILKLAVAWAILVATGAVALVVIVLLLWALLINTNPISNVVRSFVFAFCFIVAAHWAFGVVFDKNR